MRDLSDVCANAIRLHSDAEFLFRSARWRSSVALAILAIEESGKYIILKLELGRRDKIYSHQEKQTAAFFYISCVDVMKEISIFLSDHGLELKHRTDLTDSQLSWLDSEQGQKINENFFSSTDPVTIKEMEKIIRTAFDAKDLIDAKEGFYNKLKKQALYVDVDVRPRDFIESDKEEKTAQRCLEKSKLLIEIIKEL